MQNLSLVKECKNLAFILQNEYKDHQTRITYHRDGSFSCTPYDHRDCYQLNLFDDGRVSGDFSS